MDKSPEAFRTISEVAETLETPAHVLRFWESRFPQIRPVKRAGGRRYYRPADVALLTGIKRLLHEEGLTIRGVQKILREQGVRHVAGLAGAPEADLAPFDPAIALEEAMAERFGSDRFAAERLPSGEELPMAEVETAQIFALETALRRAAAEQKPEAPDLFDLLDDAPPTAEEVPEPSIFVPDVAAGPHFDADRDVPVVSDTEDVPENSVVAAEDVPERTTSEPAETVHMASRAALLRALPRPLPDDLRHLLEPLRNRMALHRDRLIEAAHPGSHRG